MEKENAKEEENAYAFSVCSSSPPHCFRLSSFVFVTNNRGGKCRVFRSLYHMLRSTPELASAVKTDKEQQNKEAAEDDQMPSDSLLVIMQHGPLVTKVGSPCLAAALYSLSLSFSLSLCVCGGSYFLPSFLLPSFLPSVLPPFSFFFLIFSFFLSFLLIDR